MPLRSWLKILFVCVDIPQSVNVSWKMSAHQYPSKLNNEDLAEEMMHLPAEHKANFGNPELKTLELPNLLTECKF